MESTKGKTFNIENLEQICNIVNDDNIELLLTDFAGWLCFYNSTMKKLREEHPELTKGKKNSEIAKSSFTWTDDGVNKLTGVEITTKETGEKRKIEFKD